MCEKIYTTAESLGVTSAYIPDIIAAMPPNTAFRTTITTNSEIYKNNENKLSVMTLGAGILSIEKAGVYTRTTITENNTGGSNGKMYLGSINTNTLEVNEWYEVNGPTIYISRAYAHSTSADPKNAHRHFALPSKFSKKDVNNYCVAITLESASDAAQFIPYVEKNIGQFDVCFVHRGGADIDINTAIWFDLTVTIPNSINNILG